MIVVLVKLNKNNLKIILYVYIYKYGITRKNR